MLPDNNISNKKAKLLKDILEEEETLKKYMLSLEKEVNNLERLTHLKKKYLEKLNKIILLNEGE